VSWRSDKGYYNLYNNIHWIKIRGIMQIKFIGLGYINYLFLVCFILCGWKTYSEWEKHKSLKVIMI